MEHWRGFVCFFHFNLISQTGWTGWMSRSGHVITMLDDVPGLMNYDIPLEGKWELRFSNLMIYQVSFISIIMTQ